MKTKKQIIIHLNDVKDIISVYASDSENTVLILVDDSAEYEDAVGELYVSELGQFSKDFGPKMVKRVQGIIEGA